LAVESGAPIGETRGLERSLGHLDAGQLAVFGKTVRAFALDIANALAYN
jgi:hypothetical protein